MDLNPGSENLEVLRTKTISLIPTTRPVQTGISAIPDLGRAGKWGCEPRGAPPLGRHHEQVTLLNICSLGMYRTQLRPARPALLPRHALHPPKRSAWHCCGDLRASCGAGLRPVHTEGKYVQEGDLLMVPAKRRRSPRPTTQNAAFLLTYRSDTHTSLSSSTQVRYGRNSRLPVTGCC